MTVASPKLLQTFRDLDLRVKNSLANEESPLRLALAALSIAHDDAKQEYVSLDGDHRREPERDRPRALDLTAFAATSRDGAGR